MLSEWRILTQQEIACLFIFGVCWGQWDLNTNSVCLIRGEQISYHAHSGLHQLAQPWQ